MISLILLGEALFVGTYCMILYSVLSLLMQKDTHIFWFVFGFLKHFLGHFTGIHKYYCSYACGVPKIVANVSHLLPESVAEGFLFVAIGYGFVSQFANRYVAVFIAGFVIHIVAEIFRVHKYFCENRCKNE